MVSGVLAHKSKKERLVLYEDDHGRAVFEYDKPSSFLGQFGNDEVTKVSRELDKALESVLRRAAG